MNKDMALITGSGPARRVEVKRSIKAPIERVWRAITSAEEVSSWWQPAEIESFEGGNVKVFFDAGGEPFVNGTVKVFQAPYVLEFTWNDADDKPGLVRFDLVEESDGQTLVTLTQFVPETEITPAAAGWHDIMDRLVRHIQLGEAGPSQFSELKELYE